LKGEYQDLLQEVAGLKAVYQWEMERDSRTSGTWNASASASVTSGESPIESELVKREDDDELAGFGLGNEIDLDGMDLDVQADMELGR